MSTTTTIEPKKESLGISAALILSLVGLTVSTNQSQYFLHFRFFFQLLLVIAVLIKREIRRGNVKSKRDGHFWSCNFFRKVTFEVFLNQYFPFFPSSVYSIKII